MPRQQTLPSRPDGAEARTGRGGFSLVEVVVVLLIMGIAAAVAVPRYIESWNRLRVEAAASRIAADLDYVRRQAVVRSKNLAIQFSPTGSGSNSYSVAGIEHLDHPALSYLVKLSDPPYQVPLVSANFGGLQTLTFDRFGRPDNGGSIVVGLGTLQKTITVDANTGRATVL